MLRPLCVLLTFLFLTPPGSAQKADEGPAPAQSTSNASGASQLEKKKKQIIQLREQTLELKAKKQAREQLEELKPFQEIAPPVVGKGDDLDALIQTLEKGQTLPAAQGERFNAVRDLARRAQAESDKARKSWREIVESEQEFLDEKAELEVETLGVETPWLAGLNSVTALWVLLSWLFVGVGLFLTVHEQRLQWRRYRRSVNWALGALLFLGRMTAYLGYLIVLGALAWAAFRSGIPLLESPATMANRQRVQALNVEKKDLELEQKGLEDQVNKLDATLDSRHTKRLEAWKLRDEVAGPVFVHSKFLEEEKKTLKELLKALSLAHLTREFAEDGKARAKVTRDEYNAWTRHKEQRQKDRSPTIVRASVCLIALGVGIFPFAYSSWRRQRALKSRNKVCPLCLEGKLTSLPVDSSRPQDHVRDLECLNPKCRYRFPQYCNQLPRLYFPTYGQLGSGKTFWLVTAYNLLNNNNIPVEDVKFASIGTRVINRWDEWVKIYLPKDAKERKAVPTQPNQLPDPLLYSFADADMWGGEALMNLFDFSGEATQHQNVARDPSSRRALVMDGFILFLDPTWGFDNQMRMLAAFLGGLRQMWQLEPGAIIHIPVAVCLTKLDLLINLHGEGVLSLLEQLRQTRKDEVDQALIRRRSRMLERELRTIFPGCHISRTLREHFGRNFMFFPGTPVGLAEAEMGIEDLTKRGPYEPFGILEPILWLLHMNGHRVFGSPRTPEGEEEA